MYVCIWKIKIKLIYQNSLVYPLTRKTPDRAVTELKTQTELWKVTKFIQALYSFDVFALYLIITIQLYFAATACFKTFHQCMKTPSSNNTAISLERFLYFVSALLTRWNFVLRRWHWVFPCNNKNWGDANINSQSKPKTHSLPANSASLKTGNKLCLAVYHLAIYDYNA